LHYAADPFKPQEKASNQSPPSATPNSDQTTVSVPARIKVQPPKSAGNTLPGKPVGATPLKVSCVENRGVVSNGTPKFSPLRPAKWRHLHHTHYDIYMQEDDALVGLVEQVSIGIWLRRLSVVCVG